MNNSNSDSEDSTYSEDSPQSKKLADSSNSLDTLKKKVLYTQMKFALYGLIFMLVMGVFYREFTRPFFKGVELSDQIVIGQMLSLVHGHSFSLFFLIPLGFAFFTFLVGDKISEESTQKLQKVFKIYMIAAIGVYILLFYKGAFYVVTYDPTSSTQTFTEIDEMLYAGSVMLRSLTYTLFHVTFGVAVVWYVNILKKHIQK